MTQRLDEPQVSALVAGYGAGKTGRELAAEFGVARNSVIKLLRQQGVEIRHARVTPEESAEIVELFEGGMAQYKIAEKVGRGPGQIWHVLHRAGLVGKH